MIFSKEDSENLSAIRQYLANLCEFFGIKEGSIREDRTFASFLRDRIGDKTEMMNTEIEEELDDESEELEKPNSFYAEDDLE
jgi:hypothetical protein